MPRSMSAVGAERRVERKAAAAAVERKAYTVSEFCDAMRISKAQYYELKKIHKGPVEAHVRGRVIISVAAADQWLEEREAEAKENNTAEQHLRRKRKRR
jgi:hypothetical protein